VCFDIVRYIRKLILPRSIPMPEPEIYEYRVGGGLPEHAPSYAVRQADRDFYEYLKAGDFCYVFNSRQMGKTSLLVRTLHQLRSEGIACTTIDVSGRGNGDIQAEQWYAGIAYTLIKDFNLANPLQFMKSWWQERDFINPAQRLIEAIETVLLPNTTAPIVIFIDEIDSILSLNFSTDDFFALIRSCYDKRTTNSDYNRLTFALIGVATPSDLIADKRRTPFNIGRAIVLQGFKLDEAGLFAKGLVNKTDRSAETIVEILKWTEGQPFLTQKICKIIAGSHDIDFTQDPKILVSQTTKSNIIDNWKERDDPQHLQTIQNRLLNREELTIKLLWLYKEILDGKEIKSDSSPEQVELKLSGLVVDRNGNLEVFNRIYREVFNLDWLMQKLSELSIPYLEKSQLG
jgi:AAA-like domain